MKNSIFLLSLLVLFAGTGPLGSQTIDPVLYDYSEIDNYARSLSDRYKDLDKLANDLTRGLDTDHEKVRAIFTWISGNIGYDTKAAHKKSSTVSFTYSTEEELQQLLAEENERVILEVLNKKKGVCEGYARLFKTLCDKCDIRAEVINGYARNRPSSIGKEVTGRSNHAWNAVFLYDKWYLLDVTWGSGYTDPGVTKFTKEFRPGYFLTPPEKLIMDHYPDDADWQLLNRKVTRKEFFNYPLVKAGFLKYNISDYHPEQGTIIAKRGKAIIFEFTSDKNINQILIHKHNQKYSDEVNYGKNGGKYQFQYTLENKGTLYLTIFINGESAMVYKAEVR